MVKGAVIHIASPLINKVPWKTPPYPLFILSQSIIFKYFLKVELIDLPHGEGRVKSIDYVNYSLSR